MRILSASQIYPVRPVYAWDDAVSIGASGSYLSTADGFELYCSDISNNCMDFKMNRNTIMHLASMTDTADIAVDATYDTGLMGNYALYATTFAGTGTNVVSGQYCIYTDIWGDLKAAPLSALSGDYGNIFTVSTSGSNGVEIQIRRYDNALTYVDEFAQMLYFNPLDQNQFLQLSPMGNGWYEILSENGSISISADDSVQLDYFAFSKDGITAVPMISEIQSTGFSATNRWVQYDNIYKPEYSKDPAILSVSETNNISGVELNHLLIAPYYSITFDPATNQAVLPFDIIPLKNFKSINSDQMLIPSEVESINKIGFREYNRIYSGGSQIEGYPNINLGYDSTYGTIISLKKDAYTYFHIPEIATEYHLSATNLQGIGAVAGPVPAFSDRIYKKLANYRDNIWWGGDEEQINDGTWLCAWLSGSEDASIWMERYYDPGQITYAAAMTVSGYPQTEFSPTSATITDIPSKMTLTPGAYFKYFHAGVKTLSAQVAEAFGTDASNIIFNLSEFSQDATTVEDSNGSTIYGTILNPINATVTTLDISVIPTQKSAILFNNYQNEILISPSSEFDTPSGRTTMGWFYSDDWQNSSLRNYSGALYSNFNNGGDKLEYITNGLYYSSILPLTSAGNSNHIAILPSDSNNNVIYQIPSDLSGISTAVDLDGNLWACGYSGADTNVYKMAPNGTVLINTEFGNKKFDQIIIVDDNTGYLLDKTNNSRYEFNIHSLEINSISVSELKDTMYITMGGEISAHNFTAMDQFSDGTICSLNGGTLLVGGSSVSIPITGTVKHICCDVNKYLYVASQETSTSACWLHRYDKNEQLWDAVGISELSGNNTAPHRVYISKEKFNNEIQDIIYWLQPTGKLTKAYSDINGILTKSSSIEFTNTRDIVIGESDFSGYKLNKVMSAAYGEYPVLKYSVLLNSESPAKRSVYCSLSGMTNNWHHFASVADTDGIKIMIDGTIEAADETAIGEMIYAKSAGYAIGTDIISEKSLSVELSSTIGRFDIGIADFMVLSKGLSDVNISGIYNLYFAADNPLQWPIKTESRSFVEEIQAIHKFKVPGMKSQFYNVVVRNLNFTDAQKEEYEILIRETAEKETPDYLKLKDIIWK